MPAASTYNPIAPPLLRWAGSKRKLVPSLASFWKESFNRYLEPFAGSACLFLALGPKEALLNDLNVHVIDTYRAVRSKPREVHAILSTLPRTREFYYLIRPTALRVKDPVLKAAFFLYLNRNCFNGLFRTNASGDFNVPFAGQRTGRDCSLEHLELVAKALRRTTLVSEDFEKFVMSNARKGDFVYLDPPYAVENERIFNQYGPTTFGTNDLLRLSKVLSTIDERGATFVLSYADGAVARRLFSNWRVDDLRVKRSIASFVKHRRIVKELVVSNADPRDAFDA